MIMTQNTRNSKQQGFKQQGRDNSQAKVVANVTERVPAAIFTPPVDIQSLSIKQGEGEQGVSGRIVGGTFSFEDWRTNNPVVALLEKVKELREKLGRLYGNKSDAEKENDEEMTEMLGKRIETANAELETARADILAQYDNAVVGFENIEMQRGQSRWPAFRLKDDARTSKSAPVNYRVLIKTLVLPNYPEKVGYPQMRHLHGRTNGPTFMNMLPVRNGKATVLAVMDERSPVEVGKIVLFMDKNRNVKAGYILESRNVNGEIELTGNHLIIGEQFGEEINDVRDPAPLTTPLELPEGLKGTPESVKPELADSNPNEVPEPATPATEAEAPKTDAKPKRQRTTAKDKKTATAKKSTAKKSPAKADVKKDEKDVEEPATGEEKTAKEAS